MHADLNKQITTIIVTTRTKKLYITVCHLINTLLNKTQTITGTGQ